MGHITSKAYYDLQKRLDESPQSAPESKVLFDILKLLFSEDEAQDASLLPLNLFTAKEASKILKISIDDTKKRLDSMADKGLLLDLFNGNEHFYFLAPPMVGFFEFALMRTDGLFNEKIASELFSQYLDSNEYYVEEGIAVFPLFYRVFVHESALCSKTVVLDYEKARKVIEDSHFFALGRCYCRHKKEHEGKKCSFPQEDVCLSLNKAAESLVKHGIAKEASKEEALKNLDRCVELGLVQIGDNVQNNVNWICNCCSCCCEALSFYKRFNSGIDLTSNFVSECDKKKCVSCGVCVNRCPVGAIKIVEEKGVKFASVDKSVCIGCGVCSDFCPEKCISMIRRDKINATPKDNFELLILDAIDKNRLQNYLFDGNRTMTHEVLRKFIGVLLKLSPSKYILANEQLRSRFLNALTHTDYYKNFHELYYKGKDNVDYSHDELKKIRR